jgi:hypothetical protein
LATTCSRRGRNFLHVRLMYAGDIVRHADLTEAWRDSMFE